MVDEAEEEGQDHYIGSQIKNAPVAISLIFGEPVGESS